MSELIGELEMQRWN